MKTMQTAEHELIEASKQWEHMYLFSKACEICEDLWKEFKMWEALDDDEYSEVTEMNMTKWYNTIDSFAKLFECDVKDLM